VRRIWQAHGLKPYRFYPFKPSNDPRFAEKLEDVVSRQLDPPEHALDLSPDEKSQIQALDRTQPRLPMKKGRAQTMTHDYKRHGTTTVIAALDPLGGTVIANCMERYRHQEWLKFLRLIDRQTPKGKQLDLIVDNYATHKHAEVLKWAAPQAIPIPLHPNLQPLPNMVERFFRDLTQNQLRQRQTSWRRSNGKELLYLTAICVTHNTRG
jgi:hypothetical protein